LSITENYKVIAADINFGYDYGDNNDKFKLKPLYTNEEYKKFMKFMDREYDKGYGSQNLHGIIYCEDNIWIDRGEYDGSEWWNVNKYPDLRKSFDEIDVIKYERNKKLKSIENRD